MACGNLFFLKLTPLLLLLFVCPAQLPSVPNVNQKNKQQRLKQERHGKDDNFKDADKRLFLGNENLLLQGDTTSNGGTEKKRKPHMALYRAGGKAGMSGKWVNEFEKQQQEKKILPQTAAKRTALKEELIEIEKEEFKNALNEVDENWQSKVGKSQGAQMAKDFIRKARKRAERKSKADKVQMQRTVSKAQRRKLYGEEFDKDKFRADAEAGKACNEEPLQLAQYYLFKGSHKIGCYHAGLLVCGIEIHFHRTGINYWKPMEYSTKLGGTHRDYLSIYHNGHELYTNKSFREIVALVRQLKVRFNASTYNMMTRNCLWFLRVFVRQLTGLTKEDQIVWPPSAIHPLKKPYFGLMNKLKKEASNKKGSQSA